MAQQTINIGAAANDNTGDRLRIAYDKCNDNFDELYTDVATLQGSQITQDDLERVGEATATGSTGESVSFDSQFISGSLYVISLDWRGVNIGVQITAQDENGFTYDSDSSGTFGYACKKIND